MSASHLGYLFEDRRDGFHVRDWNENGDSRGEFDLDGVLGRLGGLDTQKCAGLGFSSEFAFPLVGGPHRPVDRLAELRDRDIGSLALGDTLGPNLGVSRMVSET